MAELDYHVVHELPGRVRLRVPSIKHDRRRADHLAHMIGQKSGVSQVRTNPHAGSVIVMFDPSDLDPLKLLEEVGLGDVDRMEREVNAKQLPAPLNSLRRATFRFEAFLSPPGQLLLSATALAATLLEAPLVVTSALCSLSVLPIVNRAVQTLLDDKRLGGDFLDGTTCIMLIRRQTLLPAGVMTFLISLGEFVRHSLTRRCQQMISHQLELFEHSVWLVQGKDRVRVPLSKLQLGDQIVIYPGEIITFEGKVARGKGTVIPATPEVDIAPRAVQRGDLVPAKTVLADGKLYIEVTHHRPSEEPDAIRKKQNRRWLQRTQLHRNALRKGYNRVWLTMGAAGLVLGITRDINRALSIMCFDFLTGVRIAMPSAVLSSMYEAGRQGILIRNAHSLERLAEIDTIVFARSGVLTAMQPHVTNVYVTDAYSMETVTRYAAALEQRYNHLTAHAISSFGNITQMPVPERHKVKAITGLGMAGDIEDHFVLIGSTRFMQMREIDLSQAQPMLEECQARGDARACVAIDGKLAGIIAYKDPMRPGTQHVIHALQELGITELAMASGGSQSAAETFARHAGIQRIYPRAMPEDKAEIVCNYKRQGRKVAYVGYDVADGQALEEADVAITLSSAQDVARYRADVVITSEGLISLAEGIRVARSGMALARQNLMVVSVPNWLGLGISLADETDVLSNTILNNGSVILGALNGLRPLLRTGHR
ncbi:MAG TPA: HAD-IC family P-type ATPase [Candidatus Obscuribacterales bacterium]